MQVSIETLGTSKRKVGSGDDFEVMVNATCKVLQPSDDDVKALHGAVKTQRQTSLEGLLCTVSSMKVGRGEDDQVKVNFVLHNPSADAVAKAYGLLRDDFAADVTFVQAQFGVPANA